MSTPKNGKEYLTGKALDSIIPKGKRIFKVDQVDKRYEFYYIGFVPPDRLNEEEQKGHRPVYWYDLSLDVVKIFNVKSNEWVPAELDTPKFALNIETLDFGGQVEEDEKESKSEKKGPVAITDLLNDEI